jgi:hypothetical protein
MFRKTLLVGVLGLVSAGSAFAQSCPCNGGAGNLLNQTALAAALAGRTACAVSGSDLWQELHSGVANATSGPLLELGNKVGGETVGSWNIALDGAVTYTYGGGSSYSYSVCEEGAGAIPTRSYHFCGAKVITNAKLVDGQGLCGAGFTRP